MSDELSTHLKTVAVYCGASMGNDPVHAIAARQLAQALVEQNIALVYGGGRVGLIGVIGNEMLRLGGNVTGVVPQALMANQVGHANLTRVVAVKDMHERKAMMAQLSDGFIAMPGGMGTLEELFEMLTWAQLGIHAKPIGRLNTSGLFDGLIAFVAHLCEQGFIRPAHAALMLSDAQPGALLRRLRGIEPTEPKPLRE